MQKSKKILARKNKKSAFSRREEAFTPNPKEKIIKQIKIITEA
ncbi:MAG: hypothetical protein SFV53_01030 [Rickettsiales bacterium]|nr:hypothetical protein [Rickettsiales bacterium]